MPGSHSARRSIRIVVGSYEHSLLCVALTLPPKDTPGIDPVFTPVFHFTPHTQSIRCVAWTRRWLISGSNDELVRLYDLARRRELGTLVHHSGQVVTAEFYGSKWLLTGASDGVVCIWRTRDWELLAELRGHRKGVTDLAVHSSGRIALSVGDDRRLVLWNLMTARKASIQKLPASPLQVSWLPASEGLTDASRYVIGYDRSISLHRSAQPDHTWQLASPLQHLAFHDGWLVVATNDGVISWYSVKEPRLEPEFTLRGHATRVKDFAFLDNYMASVSSDGSIVVWDVAARDQIAVYSTGERLNCVAVVPDEVETAPPKRTAIADSDWSESEAEAPVRRPKKAKRSKVVVENAPSSS